MFRCQPRDHHGNLVLRLKLKSWKHRLLLAKKPLMKTGSQGTKKSSKKPTSTVDVDIFYTNGLLLIEKPLTKTESLLFQKSSKKPSSIADAEIFKAHRLLPTQKPWMKPGSLGPKNHLRSQVLRPTLISSTHIDYCSLTNRWRKLDPANQKSSKKPTTTPDADIFYAHRLLLT